MEVTIALLGVVFTTLILTILRWAIRRYNRHQVLKRYGIPGPKPDFFAGNMYQLKKDPTPNTAITSWLQKYGDVFGYYLGDEIYVVVKDLEMLKTVLIKEANHFTNRPEIFIDFGPFPKTLVGLRDRRWKEVRSIVTPTFSSGKMKMMTDIISRKVDLTVDLIIKKGKKDEMFNIYSTVQGLTLDVIAACALAMKTKCQEDENDALLQNVRNLLRYQYNKVTEYTVIFPFITKILYHLDIFSLFGKSVNFIVDHLKSVVQERRKNKDFKSFDILQALLDSSNTTKSENATTLTEEEVVANAFVVFLAGYETTATALAFTFYELVKHPEVQERLYQEIRKAKDSSYASIQNIPYLDQVFNEALRLHPPVTGFTSRTSDQDFPIGSFTIPKGSHVLAPVWDIHHDPDLWPDPWKFDPDRFSPDNKGSIESLSFMPFGSGPRNCVGARFALLEAKMILFKLLKKVKLVPCEKTEDELSLICHTVITLPANGVWVKAVPRGEN